jgi:hypothetical protein
MPELIRSASLMHYLEVASSVGLDPYQQPKAAGLSPACLANPDTMIRVSAAGRLLEWSAKAAGIAGTRMLVARTASHCRRPCSFLRLSRRLPM